MRLLKAPILVSQAARHFSLLKSASIPAEQFKYHLLDESSLPGHLDITRDSALQMVKDMQTIRSFELKADNLYKNQDIKGFCHLSLGQEACNVGLEYSIEKDDVVCQSYRMHGIAYLRGHSVQQILGELCGKSIGSSQGKGGSMHYYGKNLYGGYGIVGSQVPISAGVGFAMKYQGSKSISVGLYGDGASNQGQIFEAFNMAKLYNCPTIFICENNQYGMGTSIERSSACTDYYTRGQFIPGIKCNGQDLASVLLATKFAADWCRAGKGPMVLEYETYRFAGHSMSDPGLSYRSRDEIKHKKENADPIRIFWSKLVQASLVVESELENIVAEIEETVDAATEEVLESPPAKMESLYSDIYNEYTGDLKNVRGRSYREIYEIKN